MKWFVLSQFSYFKLDLCVKFMNFPYFHLYNSFLIQNTCICLIKKLCYFKKIRYAYPRNVIQNSFLIPDT